jgi:hypothetical protein
MAYRAVFRGDSFKEFQRLTQGQRKAIAVKIDAIETDPFAEGSIALASYAPLRRIKASDAKMIYDPEPDANGRLSILAFGTDHSIYERDELLKEWLRDRRL